MSIFCRCWRKVPPRKISLHISDILASLLEPLNIYFPKTFFACVIEMQTGNVVGSAATSAVDDPTTPSLKIGAAVSGLKHAATQFSHVFQQGVCRVVHIHGEGVLFSCFDLGDRHLLAFYSENLSQSVLDTQEADRGVEEAMEELRTILSQRNGGIR